MANIAGVLWLKRNVWAKSVVLKQTVRANIWAVCTEA